MSYKTYSTFNTKRTHQSKPIAGKNQVENNAGGYVFGISIWEQLERFLILGTEGGTYYVNGKDLTEQNAGIVSKCIKSDGVRTVDTIVSISDSGRAVKNDPALFALAMCLSVGDHKTRARAKYALPKVARIFTHLSHFLTYVQGLRGWGRILRDSVASWYTEKSPNDLAYQLVKYRQRDGWTHRDAIRLSHPKPENTVQDFLFGYAVGKKDVSDNVATDRRIQILKGYELAQLAKTESDIVKLISEFGLTREMIPNEYLKSAKVWEALFGDGKMPIHALVRNLGNMSKVGFLAEQNFDAVNSVANALTNVEKIKKSRLHPLSILTALKTYSSGQGWKGSGSWDVAPKIVDALDGAFYKSFDTVEPTGKKILLACDVSGSMSSPIAGMNISAREATATLALVTASVEPNVIIKGFSHEFVDLNISPRQRLDDVVEYMRRMPFGRTDCSLPIVWALKENINVDAFIILTDNETWCGNIHPVQALADYRNKINPNAKLIVVGMTSTGFSIADPSDANSLDIVGMDTAIPTLINNFIGS